MYRFLRDYKLFHINIGNVDYESSSAIQSAICSPLSGSAVKVDDGKVNVKGYAWRVEEGAYQELMHQQSAQLKSDAKQKYWHGLYGISILQYLKIIRVSLIFAVRLLILDVILS